MRACSASCDLCPAQISSREKVPSKPWFTEKRTGTRVSVSSIHFSRPLFVTQLSSREPGPRGPYKYPSPCPPRGTQCVNLWLVTRPPCPIPVVAINNKWLVAWCSIVALISLLLHLRLPLFYGNIFITLIEYCFISLRYSRDIVHC